MISILRGSVFHTTENAFHAAGALRAFADGALAIADGRVVACGDYSEVRRRYPEAVVRDLTGSVILPGFVDTHIHFPQVRIVGGLGYSLLDWLVKLTFPEEARFADTSYAEVIAREFVHSLASHGTTTALVFGAHFAEATAALFDAASERGLRIVSGLVLADCLVGKELLSTPDRAWRECSDLMVRVRKRQRLRYAVIPRFALSASEPMLEVCQALLQADSTSLFTSHINENRGEIASVASLFPWASDYLAVYEKYDLIGRRSVLAHNVHPTDSEIDRLASRGATIAHCPCSNAALGSGIFPMLRHLKRNARFALGTDVGGGIGFGMLKEAMQAYLMQRIAPDPMTVTPAQMLYLATLAGAEALGMKSSVGDFTPGKQADYVVIRPVEESPLSHVLKSSPEPERALAALFTLGSSKDIREVCVGGDRVYENR